MAIVIDEFRRHIWAPTIEDILELIMGGIEDEYDDEDDIDIHPLKSSRLLSSTSWIEDFNEAFNYIPAMKKLIQWRFMVTDTFLLDGGNYR